MARLVDFAAGRPNPDRIREALFDGVIRYMANSPDRGLPNKILLPEEAKAYRDRGLEIVSNWQKTKADWRGGEPQGRRDAEAALANHFACGGPGFRPIYFSVDADVDLDTWNALVLPYLNGAAAVLGREWVGVYGGQRSMWWAEEDGFRWRWQTKAWSRYDAAGSWDPNLPIQWVEGVQIRQERVDQDRVDGVGVDVNTTWAVDYGQWSLAPAPAVKVPENPAQTVKGAPVVEIDMYGNGYSSRNGAKVVYALLHTEEGGKADGSGVESLARYCGGANGVSYHDIVGAGKLVHVVNDDYASWSVLDANPYTYNLCFAGSRAGWSRDQWLARDGDLMVAAQAVSEVCRRKGIPIRLVSTRQPGISDHKFVTVVLGIGNHTDVGAGFPWDVFERYLGIFTPPLPSANEIDREASEAAGWIGARLSGELVCPDGVGRRSEFENGEIYWHPRVADAHAVPAFLFEAYAEYGWEAGFLGYPVADHTVLPDGEVQAFENGVLYRKNNSESGFHVHGYIFAAWRSAGYEDSTFGWPTSLEYPVGSDGTRAQDFEGGRIVWSPNGTVGLKPLDGPDEVIATSH